MVPKWYGMGTNTVGSNQRTKIKTFQVTVWKKQHILAFLQSSIIFGWKKFNIAGFGSDQ
jgi:hypothetical protein